MPSLLLWETDPFLMFLVQCGRVHGILSIQSVAKCFVSPPAPKRHHMPHRASADVVQRRRGILPRGHFRLIEADAHFFHSQVARLPIYENTLVLPPDRA